MSSKTRQISWHYLGVKWQGNTSPVFRGHQDWEEFCLSLHNAVQILWSRSDFTTNERAEETPKYLSGTWHFFTAGSYDIPIFRYLFHRKNGHIRIPKTTHDHMFNSQRFTKTQGKFLVQKTSPTLQLRKFPSTSSFGSATKKKTSQTKSCQHRIPWLPWCTPVCPKFKIRNGEKIHVDQSSGTWNSEMFSKNKS